VELASCHPSGTYNLKVPSRFLENLCTPAADIFLVVIYFVRIIFINFKIK